MMSASLASYVRTMPDWRAAWQCSPSGFVAVSPLHGSRAVLAVGRVTQGSTPDGVQDVAAGREEMRSVLEDRALVEGHDPASLFHRVNATLSTTNAGRIDALALLTRAGDGVPPAIVGVGRPLPLVVTPDGLSARVEGTVALGPGWTVVIAAPAPAAPPQATLLSPDDVAAAKALFTKPSAPGAPIPRRTLLAVLIDG